VLSASERSAAEAYLKTKYGLGAAAMESAELVKIR
jgi:hypothetical protein